MGWAWLLLGLLCGVASLLGAMITFFATMANFFAVLGTTAVLAVLGGAFATIILGRRLPGRPTTNFIKITMGYSFLLSILLVSTVFLYALALWPPQVQLWMIWLPGLGLWAFFFGLVFYGTACILSISQSTYLENES